ncbi:hypothetical protein, partial [Arthrobacter sp. 9V]|uniref:hypothetical protein n=1 Tax=Arthrobacter sp. 9V TaxID=2653132 RepID=UPI001F476D20
SPGSSPHPTSTPTKHPAATTTKHPNEHKHAQHKHAKKGVGAAEAVAGAGGDDAGRCPVMAPWHRPLLPRAEMRDAPPWWAGTGHFSPMH